MEAAAVILVGGRSRRMGRPKAWLEFDGVPLLTLLGARLATAFPEVLIVAAAGQELPPVAGRVLRDDLPDAGPLAAMAVGLAAATRPVAFVTAVDAPFVSLPLAQALLAALDGPEDADAALPEWNGRPQPLTAVYRCEPAAAAAAALLAGGERRALALAEALRARRVPEAEVRRIVPDGRAFLNLNTPADYAEALRLWAPGGPPALDDPPAGCYPFTGEPPPLPRSDD
jgi:molybdopterin-guanine dinucleotide biosynthesis protein A